MGITYAELLNLDRFMGRDFRKRFFGGKVECLENPPTERATATEQSIAKSGTNTGTGLLPKMNKDGTELMVPKGWTVTEGPTVYNRRSNVEKTTNPKDKVGRSKPQLHLIPPVANLYEAKVMKSGAGKYGPFNWRQDKIATSTYISAIYRHLAAFQDGATYDPDSGMPHMAHIRANTGIVIDAMEQGMAIDDRVYGPAAKVVDALSDKKETKDTTPTLPPTEPGESMHDYIIRCASIMGIDNPEEFIHDEDYLTGSSEVGVSTPPPESLDEACVAHFTDKKYTTGAFFDPTMGNIRDPHGPYYNYGKMPAKFYIAGPMRGYHEFNFPAFDAAAERGRKLGYSIVSPAELDREAGFDPATKAVSEDDMRAIIARDVHAILTLKPSRGDGIALIDGWQDSTGARAELALAEWMGLKIVNGLNFLPMDRA